MASIKFEIKKEDVEKLNVMLAKAGDNAERETNDFLHNTASKKIIASIIELVPISDRKKTHAKESSPFESHNINMGIIIRSKQKFNYLIFPDLATGTSFKNDAKEFMKNGLENEYQSILKGIMDGLNKSI